MELGQKSYSASIYQKMRKCVMSRICEIVEKALMTGYLTVEAEDQLRQLLSMKYDWEDFRAFIRLQQEAMEGRVKQESRELMYASQPSSKSFNQEIAIAS
jgi:hypothetical protein